MNDSILISICIPAYKREVFLKRLLDSIQIQDYRHFEVIVTDDSPDDNVKLLCDKYMDKFELYYFRNEQPLGTPENWNEAIRRAKGNWIKLMHDDDWFAGNNSLQVFVEAIRMNTKAKFFFAAYSNIFEDGRTQRVFPAKSRLRWLEEDPATLLSKNIIGPPSVILTKNDTDLVYDKNIKWLVDIDFYMRYLASDKPVYINQPLLNVGLGKHQVTVDCVGQRKVEIPENFYLLNKIGNGHLKNILVYDAWWRLLRNLEISNENDIREAGYSGEIPAVISYMIKSQQKIPRLLLKVGAISKASMFTHFILHRSKI